MRFVVFQTCAPAASPYPDNVTYAVFELFGSMMARAMYAAGTTPVTSISGLPPVVVANTFPFSSPTMRTASFCGEIPIALTAVLATKGPWLTATMVPPRSTERYKRSVPK